MEMTPIRESHSPLTVHLELPGVNVNTLSPVAYVAVQSAIKERYMDIQANVEKEIGSLRARDAGWEDLVDVSVIHRGGGIIITMLTDASDCYADACAVATCSIPREVLQTLSTTRFSSVPFHRLPASYYFRLHTATTSSTTTVGT